MKRPSGILSIIIFLFLTGCVSSISQAVKNSPTFTPLPTRAVPLPTATPIPPTEIPIATGIPTPDSGYLYHGVYPGGTSGEEDDITMKDLISYEETVGKTATWVYFSNNWYHDMQFPGDAAGWIREAGSIPYIRLMLRPDLKFDGGESMYSTQNIIDGKFDDELHHWCADARQFATNIIVEYGTEVNSDSFVWSGIYNGADTKDGYGDPTQPDGTERFRDAYRHIVQICRDEGAVNITWVFHLDSESHPDTEWNSMENYYPGDEWVDWIGVSIYGTYRPNSNYFDVFPTRMEAIYPRIVAFAPHKPIIIAEFGTAKGNPLIDQAQWTRDALDSILSGKYPNLIGFSWWNEAWENSDDPDNDTTMRVQDNPDLAAVFLEYVGNNPKVLGELTK